MRKSNKKNNDRESKKGIANNPILFFGFYLLFFIILIALLRNNNNLDPVKKKYEREDPIHFDINQLNSNYSFNNKIILDGVVYNYVGNKNNYESNFTYNNINYYRNGDEYFVNNVKVDNPYIYPEFMKIENIINIINKSTYNSKISYDSGKEIYNLSISTNTLNKLLYDINTDFDELPNEVIISADEYNNISSIIFNIGSFCILNKKCNSNLKIQYELDNYDKVSKIDNPSN